MINLYFNKSFFLLIIFIKTKMYYLIQLNKICFLLLTYKKIFLLRIFFLIKNRKEMQEKLKIIK